MMTPTSSLDSFVQHSNQLTRDIKQGKWNTNPDSLCPVINDLMQKAGVELADMSLDGAHQGTFSAALMDLEQALTSMQNSTGKIRTVIDTLKQVFQNKSEDPIKRFLVEVSKNYPAGSEREIEQSLNFFKTLFQRKSPQAPIVLAEWISYQRIPLANLDLPPDILRATVPFLKFLDTTGLDISQNELQDLLANASMLRTLNLVVNDGIRVIPPVPDGVETFIVRGERVEEITTLPDNLREFFCSYNPELKKLPHHLPTNTKTFVCRECLSLETPPVLNAGLKTFICSNCPAIRLPPRLDVQEFDCSYCPMQMLPILGNGLEKLICNHCENLQELFSLPASLEYIDTSDCENLSKIDALPPNIKSIDTSRCPKLVPLA